MSGILFTVSSLGPDPRLESLGGDKVISALFIIENVDYGMDDEFHVRPLCSYLLMYYSPTKRAAVIDIPGSLGLIIQRFNRVDRIDSLYDPRRVAPYVDEIEKLLGLEIPFSVVITHENLGKVTDLIEGVELFIPSPVEEYHDGYILFPSGVNYLDGDKAKAYVTYELPEENSEMVNFRRHRFFMSFIKRLGEQNQYLKNPQNARLFHSLVKTGATQRVQARLFEEFAGIDTDRVSIQSVGGNVREVSGQELLFPHWDGSLIKEIMRQTAAGLIRPMEGPQGDRVFTVEVMNGTAVTGLAGRTAELFRGFGYDIVAIGNADSNTHEKTEIVYRLDFEDAARALGNVIRCDNIRGDTPVISETESGFNIQSVNYTADLTIIIGRDFNGRYVTQ